MTTAYYKVPGTKFERSVCVCVWGGLDNLWLKILKISKLHNIVKDLYAKY